VPELKPENGESVVEKRFGDSFKATTFETVLSGLGVGSLVVVGAQTDACIRSRLHGVLIRGYDALLVNDAHTTEDQRTWGAPAPELVIAHTNMYLTY
jgi:nicotinamidase-related amidase